MTIGPKIISLFKNPLTATILTIIFGGIGIFFGYRSCWPEHLQPTLIINGQVVTGPTVSVTGGIVSISPAPGADGRYAKDTTVALTATPASGYRFSSWGGDVSGSANPVTISMNSNKSVTANFIEVYTLTTSVSPTGGGSISVSPAPGADGRYARDTTVTLTATPASGYRFSSWGGDASGSANPVTISMNSNKSVTAIMIISGDLVKLSDTTHIYTNTFNGGNRDNSDGVNSIDGDFSTSFGYGNSGGEGGREITVVSEHVFSRPVTLNQIKYRMYADARANGKYIRTHNIEMYVQYFDTDWHDVPGSHYTAGGGEGEADRDTGNVTYTGTLSNVTKIKAYCHAYSLATGGEAGCNSEAWIYEIQGWGELIP